ncbi:MAG: hypothetical protein R2760_05045 [Chitinophagales bacterium]|nr:hypothetical protein [Chitinophagales bacterium]
MQQRIVTWGEIGTDLKALITIELDEANANIIINAFPKEKVSKELQDAIFNEWKNGGNFQFPETTYQWTVDAQQDNILPNNVRVDRPILITEAQSLWSRKLMSAKLNQLLNEEVALLNQQLEGLKEFEQSLWDKAKTQWDKIADYQKKAEISWEQTTILKDKINLIFDSLKALKRINHEGDEEKTLQISKAFNKVIDELEDKLIYPDEWNNIFNELKKIQTNLKESPIKWSAKRKLQNKINDIYAALKKYRSTEFINKSKARIKQLNQILSGFKENIERDKENYKMQVEKMQHYTRGKLTEAELQERFSHLFDRIKSKEEKIKNISKTINDIERDIQKEQNRQEQELQKAKEQDKQNQEAENNLSDQDNNLNNPTEEIASIVSEDAQPKTTELEPTTIDNKDNDLTV